MGGCLAGGNCSINITLKSLEMNTVPIINLSELRLFDKSHAQIPRQKLNIWMSSYTSTDNGPAMCIDGMPTVCHSDYLHDRNPRLGLSFPCSEGLSKVEVDNRPNDCYLCQDRITLFRMRFLDPTGSEVAAPYSFKAAQDLYTAYPGEPRLVNLYFPVQQ